MAQTTNNLYYLKDKTGGRRFLPVRCHKEHCKNVFDDLTDEYVKQLWGETVNLYKSNTVDISAHIKEETELLNKQREQFKYVDSVEEKIDELMENKFKINALYQVQILGMQLILIHHKETENYQIMNVMVNKYHFKANQAKFIDGKTVKGYSKIT